MNKAEVTYYGGMIDRAGTRTETYERVQTIAELVAAMTDRHGNEFAEALAVCSFLAENGRLDEGDNLTEGIKIDVLPPFAGG